MKGGNLALWAAAKRYTPVIALVAMAQFAAPVVGAGLAAGLAAALLFALHLLTYGANAARAAAPPLILRVLCAVGLLLVVGAGAAPRLVFASLLAEIGLFLCVANGLALTLTVLASRAPTLRDEAW